MQMRREGDQREGKGREGRGRKEKWKEEADFSESHGVEGGQDGSHQDARRLKAALQEFEILLRRIQSLTEIHPIVVILILHVEM